MKICVVIHIAAESHNFLRIKILKAVILMDTNLRITWFFFADQFFKYKVCFALNIWVF